MIGNQGDSEFSTNLYGSIAQIVFELFHSFRSVFVPGMTSSAR